MIRLTMLLLLSSLLFLPFPLPAADPPKQSPTTADNPRAREFESFALTHPGNPDAGRALFENKSFKCIDCHRVAGSGGQIGPDLSFIGGKFDRPHLIESLLDPSRQIVEGFRPTTLVLKDGTTRSGLIKNESPNSLDLATPDARITTINIADIDERKPSSISLMPQNLFEQLSPEQFTDLIAFLETLQDKTKPPPGATTSGPISLPPEFTLELITTDLDAVTTLETLPDNRVLICQQTGALRVVENGKLLSDPMITLPVEVNWERGLIGVTIDPGFPEQPFVYLCRVLKTPCSHHRISRFTLHGNKALSDSELILLEGDDQSTLGGNVPAGHQGGALHFGHDGKLYIGIGEQTAATPSQRLDSLLGKLLRINPDGSIPKDNPFLDRTKGKYQSIWALGLRNPFTFAVHPGDGRIFINDVGGNFEEINLGLPGKNYGWPTVEHGPTTDPAFVGPIHHYPQASISGGDFVPPSANWPQQLTGRYLFADFVHGWIKSLDPDHPADVHTFATGLRRPVDLRFAPDGSLYVLLRNAWVIDDKFQPNTGSLLRIRHTPSPKSPGQN